MTKQFIGLFPGQGSQKVGMGKALYDNCPLAKEMFAIADDALGIPLSKICFEGPEDELTKTSIGQPAILTVSSICFALAKEHLGSNLVAVAGHSLGEYSALVAAGAIDFADAVTIVHQRGKYMQEAVPIGAGKMMAVLGMSSEELSAKIAEIEEVVEIANNNAPGQIVVSGSTAGITAAKAVLAGKKVIDLAVSAPFHCSLMQPAADRLSVDLDALSITEPSVPLYANVTAKPTQEVEVIRTGLKNQVCGQVRWVESVQAMRNQYPDASFLEFGNGNVLTGLLKRIDKAANKQTIGTLDEIEGLANA